MSNPLGFVLPAASIGLGAILFKPKRGFSYLGQPLIPQATLEEIHRDDLEITEHPVEQNAPIADHAFKRPAEVIIRCAWSNSPSAPGGLLGAAVGIGTAVGGPVVGVLASAGQTIAGIQVAQSVLSGNAPNQSKDIYEQLLKIQASRIPFDIFTGKRSYTNMLFRSLGVHTDERSENSLWLTAVCHQVIIVSTQTVFIGINPDPAEQAQPEKTQPIEDVGTQQLQPAPNFVPDPASFTPALTDAMEGAQSAIREAAEQLPALGAQVSGGIAGTLGELQTTISNTLSTATAQLPGALEQLQGQMTRVVADLQGNLPGIVSQAQAEIPAVISGARTAIQDAINQIPRAFEIPFAR